MGENERSEKSPAFVPAFESEYLGIAAGRVDGRALGILSVRPLARYSFKCKNFMFSRAQLERLREDIDALLRSSRILQDEPSQEILLADLEDVLQACPSPIRILIADDHPAIRMVLSQILEFEEDLKVVGEARNGQEAVELAQQLQPDVVLMDSSLPIMDSPEATRRTVEAQPNVAIIGMSTDGRWMPQKMEGAVASFRKGGDGKALSNLIRKIVRGFRGNGFPT